MFLYQFLFEYVTLKNKQAYVGDYNSKRALYEFCLVFINVDAFLKISMHLFLPYVSNLCIRNEFTVCSHYQTRGQL